MNLIYLKKIRFIFLLNNCLKKVILMELNFNSIETSYNDISFLLSEQDEIFRLLDENARKREKEILVHNGMTICPYNVLDKVSKTVDSIDASEIRRLADEPLNEDASKAVSCTLSSVFYASKDRKGYLLTKHIHKLKPIGSGAYGNVYSVTFDDEEALFLIKVSDMEDLTHELSVGLNISNHMRSLIPNFAYIYGGFTCSLPIVSGDDVINLCSSDSEKVTHIMYENIRPGIPLGKSIETITVDNLYSVFSQISLSIMMANKLYNFTHFDLHQENIVMRDNDLKTFQIKYTHQGRDYYVKSSKIATIIDYGMSYYELDGVSFGKPDITLDFIMNTSIYNHVDHLFADIYRLYMAIVRECYFYSRKDLVEEFCLPMHDFFSGSSSEESANGELLINPALRTIFNQEGIIAVRSYLLEQQVKEQDILYFTYPKGYDSLMSPIFLLRMIHKNSNIISNDPFSLPFLDCKTCPDFEKMLELIHSKEHYDYLDIYHIITEKNIVPELNDEELEKLKNDIAKLEREIEAGLDTYQNLDHAQIGKDFSNLQSRISKDTLNIITKDIFNIVKEYEKLNLLETDIEIIRTISRYYPDLLSYSAKSVLNFERSIRLRRRNLHKISEGIELEQNNIKSFINTVRGTVDADSIDSFLRIFDLYSRFEINR